MLRSVDGAHDLTAFEHDQRIFERLREIDVLNRRLIHVGVVLDGADQVEDADR